ncbi:hypothetical protein AVEN_162406-1 [Araneus ventricosus]|uniref:Uncharacterized protein n=1 Tax=Araneus ventricosus TaxID=182803 RepID=A0A4Y2X2Q4_ARAVE|nr:hypothetical protein AVEN_162406-1 [Araneus ventricosus]
MRDVKKRYLWRSQRKCSLEHYEVFLRCDLRARIVWALLCLCSLSSHVYIVLVCAFMNCFIKISFAKIEDFVAALFESNTSESRENRVHFTAPAKSLLISA